MIHQPRKPTVVLTHGRRQYPFVDGVIPDTPTDCYFALIGSGSFVLPVHPDHHLRARHRRLLRGGVLIRDDFRCRYCDADLLASVDSMLAITRDHVYPRSKGGPDTLDNLVCCCQTCNLMKGRRPYHTVKAARLYVKKQRQEHARKLLELQAAYR